MGGKSGRRVNRECCTSKLSGGPGAVILSAMDSLSSLELFLLAAVKEGCGTAYDLHAQAGLSVGSTQPALQRMVKKGWLDVETVGARGRMQHHLTATGRKQLAAWRQHVDLAIQEPQGDIDGLFRLMSVAWLERDKTRVKKLLRLVTDEIKKQPSEAAEFSSTLAGFHRWLAGLKAVEQRRGNLRLFKEITAYLKNR